MIELNKDLYLQQHDKLFEQNIVISDKHCPLACNFEDSETTKKHRKKVYGYYLKHRLKQPKNQQLNNDTHMPFTNCTFRLAKNPLPQSTMALPFDNTDTNKVKFTRTPSSCRSRSRRIIFKIGLQHNNSPDLEQLETVECYVHFGANRFTQLGKWEGVS